MKNCIQILSVVAVATSLSFGEEEAPKEKKAFNPEAAFKKIDTDGNGSLSLDEFKASPQGQKLAKKAEARFKKLDADSNGSLSLDEFKAGASKGKGEGKKKAKAKAKAKVKSEG